MGEYGNGVAGDAIKGAAWVKASASDAINNCVELARIDAHEVALRNSRYPQGPALVFTTEEIAAFVDGATKGEFRGMTA